MIALNAPPGAGVKAGPEPAKGHPEGLALTPARTAPHCQSREQVKPSVSVPFDKPGQLPLITRFSDQMPPVDTGDSALAFELIGGPP